MRTLIKKLFSNRSGATAVEYGLLAGLIAVAISTAVGTVGTNLSAKFNSIATALAPPAA